MTLRSAAELLRAYPLHVDRGVEICQRDEDGDDIVIAICGASSPSRSHEYGTYARRTNEDLAVEIARRVGAHDNLVDALREALATLSSAACKLKFIGEGHEINAGDEARYYNARVNALLATLAAAGVRT